MLRFECDYAEGAHPQIMERLMATNFEQTPGYGVDAHCEHARELVRDFCAAPTHRCILWWEAPPVTSP